MTPLLAGFTAVVLVAGVIAALTVDSPTPKRKPATTATTSATSGGSAPATTSVAPATSAAAASAAAAIEAFVPKAERFVEAHRGLKFLKPVTVTPLDDAAFRQRLLGEEAQDKDQITKATKVLRALGLISATTDIAKAEQTLLGDAVVGFYDPKTKALVVRGAQPTPYVRQTIVHELTHALQDQHFGIDRPDLDKADDERGDAFSALVEGDAVRVDGEYRASLSAAEQRQAETEEAGQSAGLPPDVPEVLVDLLVFPYVSGPPFTEAILRAKGQAALDAAFVKPPTTSEQVMHPEKFLAGEGARAVPKPAAGGAVIDQGVLGEYGIFVLLSPAMNAGTLTTAEVQRAAAGWGGDEYVAWDDGPRTCVRDSFVMDTPSDTDELRSALRKYAGTRSGVTIAGDSTVTLTSCG